MLSSLRASRTLRNALNFIAEDYHSLKRFGSISREISAFTIPREDYTVKKDVARANWMVTKRCRECRIEEAHQLFDEMPERDVITWTALISGYINCGMLKEARLLFDKVDALKNVVTWTAMVSGYLKSGQISDAEKLFGEMPEKNVVAWNTMMDGHVKVGRVDDALALFNRMDKSKRNVVSWHVVITGLLNVGRVEEARGLFDRMPVRNVVSWTIMVSGLARNGRIDEARLVFDRMPEHNVVSWNAMVTGYAQNMRLGEAYSLFKVMPEKNVLSWNAMITGFIQNGELEAAKRLFNQMPRKNVISWTTMISGCVRNGESEEALKLFLAMGRDERVKPNEGTFVSILGACSNLAGLCEGMQVHQVISKAVFQETEFVISALINMYSKCGELLMAERMFDDELRCHRDLVSWNAMLAAYAHHGCGRQAIAVFTEMQRMGLKPNDVSYVGLLSACSHAGLLQEGLNYFEALSKDESVKLREDHYACIVDLYSRAGRLKEAFDLLERLPVEASVSAWGALLLGCNVHGNSDMGKLVANKLLGMDPRNSGMYVLLSNMYTRAGKWREAEMVKSRMQGGNLKKQPGCSWIEIGNKVCVFAVGDGSHCETGTIRLLLSNLHREMKIRCPVLIDV